MSTAQLCILFGERSFFGRNESGLHNGSVHTSKIGHAGKIWTYEQDRARDEGWGRRRWRREAVFWIVYVTLVSMYQDEGS